MNILMCGDERTYPGMEVAIYSTLTHNKGVNIYIFTMRIEIPYPDGYVKVYSGLNDWQKTKLKKIVKYLDSASQICFIDTLEFYKEYLDNSPNQFSAFTPFATLRLIADIALPHVNDVLYLDCDTAVTGDISHIYYEYVARDCNYAAYVCADACDGEGEMVSGVMIMNLRKMRETNFLKRARENFMANQYVYPDQDAIRDAGKPEVLPETFGYCEELERLSYTPLVLHFTNRLSPKVYNDDTGRTYFFRRFPFLKYIKDGAELIDRINFGVEL